MLGLYFGLDIAIPGLMDGSVGLWGRVSILNYLISLLRVQNFRFATPRVE
jgi:hypothetical protein